LTVSRNTWTRSVGGKIIVALLMVVLLSVLIPTRGAEVARSNDQLRACQDNAGIVAAVGQSFALEISKAAIYPAHPEQEIYLQSHTIPIYPHRGPPVIS
jgi:hypothetical protein